MTALTQEAASPAARAVAGCWPAGQRANTSLVLPEKLGLDAWCRVGEELSSFSASVAWCLGDWLIFGERRYPSRYRRAVTRTGLDYQTLRNYAWAARKFPPPRRRARLSLQHHIEVAALPPGEQDWWLDFAERLRWPRDELRRQVRASTAAGDRPDLPVAQLNVSCAPASLDRWKSAARDAGAGLNEWIVQVLDSAVTGRAGKAGETND